MKAPSKPEFVFILLFPLLFIIIFELVSMYLFKAAPPFYNGQQMTLDEINFSLFSGLDPNLGYTHNSNLKKTNSNPDALVGLPDDCTDLKNGFVLMKYAPPDSTPIKIAILGGSPADPFLFHGNWPYFLHLLLKEKNVPHLIYNGSVSGYNSYQLLLKLERDVFNLDQMDFVIAYLGVNDAIANGDIINEHPAINPYQAYLFDQLNGGSLHGPANVFLPNTQVFLRHARHWLFGEKYPIVYGVENKNYADSLVKNIEYMNAITKLNSARFLYVPEVYLEREEQRLKSSFAPKLDLAAEASIVEFLKQIVIRMSSKDYTFSIQKSLPSRPIFYNLAHLNDDGNRVVAKEFQTILEMQILKNQK